MANSAGSLPTVKHTRIFLLSHWIIFHAVLLCLVDNIAREGKGADNQLIGDHLHKRDKRDITDEAVYQ